MFSSNQVITATELVRNFPRFSKMLTYEPQALLITQKRSSYLVLVSAEIFEDLLSKNFGAPKPGAVNGQSGHEKSAA
jgi:hypothetical protein